MIIDAPIEFWDWIERLTTQADGGDHAASDRLDLVHALLEELAELPAAPTKEDETATLKWVRQSRKYVVWRVSHPYRSGMAVRLICWFPPKDVSTDTVVVALFAGDKARIGDVFYDSVGNRADPLIDQWKREVARSANND